MAIRSFLFFVVVMLVIIFGFPESLSRLKGSGYLITFSGEQGNIFLRNFKLFGIIIKYYGALLLSDVRPLASELGEVVCFEKQFYQLFVGYPCRVIAYFRGLGVAGCAAAYFRIGGMFCMPAHIADSC